MTHTEISTSAEERRVALTNSSEEEAIISCMGSNYSAQKNSDLGMIISELNTSVGETQYFSEATIAKQSDPISIADQRIKNGMKMSGKKIDISVPPNWEKLKIESRNFRYKMHAWLMLDTLLSAY